MRVSVIIDTLINNKRVCLPPPTHTHVSVGVRLYFSTTPFAPLHQKYVAVRPSLLALIHVRLPPGFSASSTLQKPAKVHKALHSKGPLDFSSVCVRVNRTCLDKNIMVCFFFHPAGVLLMAASESEDSDILWCINHDSFPFKKPLMETQVSKGHGAEQETWMDVLKIK